MIFRIDLKIFIFSIIFYFTRQIEIYCYMMIFAVIHELGHLFAGILLKMRPEKLELNPLGLTVAFKINIKEYNNKIKKGNMLQIKKIIVAIAGPLINFLIILITYKLDIFIKKQIIIYVNLIIMLFNLIPLYPLDGGRILKQILHIFLGKIKANEYILIISKTVLIIITLISSIMILYIHNIAIFFVIVYLWCIFIKEEKKYKKRKYIYQKVLENTSI